MYLQIALLRLEVSKILCARVIYGTLVCHIYKNQVKIYYRQTKTYERTINGEAILLSIHGENFLLYFKSLGFMLFDYLLLLLLSSQEPP